jgi:site-specific recombinase XerD
MSKNLNSGGTKMEEQTIRQLTAGTLIELEKQHYASISILHFKEAFTRIEKYAATNGEVFLTDKLSDRYMLEVYGWGSEQNATPTAHITSQLRVFRILKCYEANGSIPGRVFSRKEPPPCFRQHFDLYITECVSRNLSKSTIDTRFMDIHDLLVYAKSKGFSNISEIDECFLDGYLLIRKIRSPGAMPRTLSSLRCFLRSMFANGCIQRDLSIFIPTGSRYPTKPVQKLWTGEEVKNLLNGVDRSDSIGKRDFAIMLLMLRYGMRTGDIRNLKLADINWENMSIQFQQEKTTALNALPILDDIGWALADWIANARPKQASSNHVFVRLTAPYSGLGNLETILKRRMRYAGIATSGCGKSGPHSLRHALASVMLAEQVPVHVISSILGHSSSASTMVYLHSDVEGLRQCALDLEDCV